MKKTFIAGLILTLISGLFTAVYAKNNIESTELNPDAIKTAIEKYKNKNYVGCISDLRLYTEQDPSSAIAWYYLGNSYMNIAMQEDATRAYDKVISLDTVPALTSYSIQANMCMQDSTKCNYHHFSRDEIEQLKADPLAFIMQYLEMKNGSPEDENIVEIQKLIDGDYAENIHPDANTLIRQERTKMHQNAINVNKAYVPQDDKLAEVLEILNKQKNNSNFAMSLDLPPTQAGSKNKISPEMLQLMMLQNQMPNF